MKKIIAEFKKFIARGNIVDMAVGVIVGSSFTAIVNALSDNILKPLINYLLKLIFGANSLSEVYTFLGDPVLDADGSVILEESIYIDWGAFINAVINFFLVAIVLFAIVKIVNTIRDGQKKWVADLFDDIPTKEDIREMKKRKIKITDDNVAAFLKEKKLRLEEEAARVKAEEEEKARLERLANPTTEDLLKQILDEIKKA
jgi:large conductance mechanosensitive channel